ncbi:MAG TPA: nuclear transport factor 2 family protein [Candidatus Sulfotelmatobacter sp.]|nr:nuclear transport factor 2 family protein [Candidatus Sulfotelmatobacter sp.]
MTLARRAPILTALLVLLMITLAEWQKQNSVEASTARQASVASDVASLRDAWVKHWNAKPLVPLLETYAADAVLLPPSGILVSGHDAVAKYWKQAIQGDVRTLSLQPVSGDSSGDFAYESGHLTYVVTSSTGGKTGNSVETRTGTMSHVNGSYLVVLRRGADGKWRIVQHAFTEALLKNMVEEKHPTPKPMMPPEKR